MILKQVYAQAAVPLELVNPLEGTNLNSLSGVFGLIFNIILGVGIALVVIFIAIAGIKYVTSQGDPKAVESAQKALTSALIGLVIVLSAVTIRYVVANLLGANIGGIANITI